MRHIISTALVAVVVSLVTVTAVGALAQSPAQGPAAEPAILPAVSNINAHKVDGKHAVGAKASRAKRAGKLVATNKAGYLPANIVKPAWKLIGGKPAGFADGVDDVGVSRITVITVSDPTPASAAGGGGYAISSVNCPAGSKVVGGGHSAAGNTGFSLANNHPSANNGWFVDGTNQHSGASIDVRAYALCLSTEPASAISAAAKRSKPSSPRGR